MAGKSSSNPVLRGGVIGAVLAVGIGLALLFFKFGLGLVHLSYDLPFAVKPVIRPQEAVMVYMDDDSHRELNQPYNAPWDRALHAQLLDRFTAEHTKAVVFDIVFSDPGPNPPSDQQLARSIKENGKVILAADVAPTSYGIDGQLAKQIVPPYSAFSDASAGMGSAEMDPDADLIIRQQLPATRDDQIPSMSWAAASATGAAVTRDEKNRLGERWLNYYGPAATIPNISFFRVVQTNVEGAAPVGFFSNKVVYVGAHLLTKFSGDRKDEYPTPHTLWDKHSQFMPGVEIQATSLLNLIRGDWLRRLPSVAEAVILSLTGLLAGFGFVRFRPVVASGIAALAMLITGMTAYVFFAHLLWWFPWVLIEVQIGAALAWSVVFNSIQLYVQNKLNQQTLELYLPPKLVKKFAASPEMLKPGAKKETLTILFSDIANFTSISEGMDSGELAKHMNKYFQTAVSDCIHATDGTKVKYIGDAIFAFWNQPEPQIDHAARACAAALKFRDQPPQYMNGQQLITRIGLHTGVADVGNFGSTTQVDYTALGENINLASRMEGLNKYTGTEVLITGDTQAEAGSRFVTRYLGDFRLKGFERSVAVHELVGPPEKAEEYRVLHEAFAAAVKLFRERKFAEAQVAFQKVLGISAQDGPSKFYLKHLAEMEGHPLPDDWSGEVELKEK